MKLTAINAAIFLTILPVTVTFAGGLDRSGQSIQAFLQPGNYTEAGISILDPDVKGKSKILKENIDDIAEDYYFINAAIKVQATNNISLGLIYDQPFGADAKYADNSLSFGNNGEGTSVEVQTQNLTALIGYQPNKNWNIYAGPVWQTVEADIKLRGYAYGGPSKLGTYDIRIKEEPAFGWIAGFAYSIPEIALKTSITYRSEVKHKTESNESLNPVIDAFGSTLNFNHETSTQAVTPQSVNIDFQTGVAANTLAFANVRWVHWDQFTVSPTFLKSMGQDLISYDKDQWSANVGVGHKFSDKWSSSTSVGWDSGAGNPVTTLGPTEGYWSLGLGAQYSPATNYFIQAGVKHLWLGDAKAQTAGQIVGDFEDNNAWAYGMKIGYRF